MTLSPGSLVSAWQRPTPQPFPVGHYRVRWSWQSVLGLSSFKRKLPQPCHLCPLHSSFLLVVLGFLPVLGFKSLFFWGVFGLFLVSNLLWFYFQFGCERRCAVYPPTPPPPCSPGVLKKKLHCFYFYYWVSRLLFYVVIRALHQIYVLWIFFLSP